MPQTSSSPIVTATGDQPSIWFEDFTPGRVFELGSFVADRDELIEFATRYDPQWYHLDEEKAKASQWGGLIASGMWTTSATMRLYVDAVLSKAAPDASPGLEEARFLKAVYVGDVLTSTLTVVNSTPSSRGDHLGTVYLQWQTMRDGEPVFRMSGRGWFYRKPTQAV